MSSIVIYGLSTSHQPDFFLSDSNGCLDLQKVKVAMEQKLMPTDDGRISGEGFVNIQIKENNEGLRYIECFTTTENSLGYYYPAEITGDSIRSNKIQHKYFNRSSLMITDNNYVIMKFDWSAEEGSKSRVKSILETLGFKISSFKVTDSLIRKIQNDFEWRAVKIDKIEKSGDKTRKVSFEIDPTDTSESRVDQEYRDHGKMNQLTFEHPIVFEDRDPNTRPMISVKLYKEGGNRIFINTDEFGNDEDVKKFQLVLLQTLHHYSV